MYLFNPDLETVKKDFKGNLYINKMFNGDAYGSDKASYKKIIKWQLSTNPQKKEKAEDDFQLKVDRNTSFITSDEDLIVWLGHASFFMRINGVSFFTDPCLKDLPIVKRQVGLPCSIYDLIGINYLLISHGHRDHYDESSVKQLLKQNPNMELLLPLKISELLGKQKKKVSFQEAAWWQKFNTTEEVEVIFLPAKHWNRRYLNDFNRQLWGSFLIRTKEKTVYFGADSAYANHYKEIKEEFGSPDIAILPIGAYKPSYVMNEAHMHPGEAVQAFHDLGAKTFIPMHYGTYDLSDEPLGEPLTILKDLEERKHINGEVKVLNVGEKFLL
ncbi:MBL fold metallo-hydrolase [Porifericola rhodea]|uniref:MBL fold metallo-hydrolase n=1 Tax=Porifericola rhodea TaxID=930972 RepID=UPI0026666ACC|nr:MBL fold metallo-hydrolase [Porifericola rhodea]WKN30161.1 MBL fold metallo-hydrolase [Porifericola rhodea]